jgi:hypothetical protein
MRITDILNQTSRDQRATTAVITADQAITRLFAHAAQYGYRIAVSPDEWRTANVSSAHFGLYDIPLSRVAVPKQDQNLYAAAVTDDPIIVDVNKSRRGFTFQGIGPEVIVVYGADRFFAAHDRGDVRIKAWVGSKAAVRLGLIQADHEMSVEELREQLDVQLMSRYPRNQLRNTPGFAGGPPWIRQIYPFEGYFIYNHQGKAYRQKFSVDPLARRASLVGVADEVIEQWVDKATMGHPTATMRITAATDIHACGCGGVKPRIAGSTKKKRRKRLVL